MDELLARSARLPSCPDRSPARRTSRPSERPHPDRGEPDAGANGSLASGRMRPSVSAQARSIALSPVTTGGKAMCRTSPRRNRWACPRLPSVARGCLCRAPLFHGQSQRVKGGLGGRTDSTQRLHRFQPNLFDLLQRKSVATPPVAGGPRYIFVRIRQDADQSRDRRFGGFGAEFAQFDDDVAAFIGVFGFKGFEKNGSEFRARMVVNEDQCLGDGLARRFEPFQLRVTESCTVSAGLWEVILQLLEGGMQRRQRFPARGPNFPSVWAAWRMTVRSPSLRASARADTDSFLGPKTAKA